jgi:transcriptional regulator with XRE-family HTH domain
MKSKNRSFNGIANLVKKYRLEHSDKLSQVELSNLLGYKNGQFISNVERGICAIPLKALKDLIRILSIPEDQLLSAMVKDYEQTVVNHLRGTSSGSDYINGSQSTAAPASSDFSSSSVQGHSSFLD